MAPSKRTSLGESPPPAKKGRPSKRKAVNLVPVVVNAIEHAEALPADLRTVLTVALPTVLDANKVDRHPYEVEVVVQAEKALALLQGDLEQKHASALLRQNEVIAPAEHAKRTADKKAAEAALQALGSKHEAAKATQLDASSALQSAKSALKAAQKEAGVAEKQMESHAVKKTTLSEMLANEFSLLKEGTSATPAGKEAVKKLGKLGKEYRFDDTLLQTFPLTCKKEPANRSDFEVMMFTTLQSNIDKLIDGLTAQIAELEPGQADKLSALAGHKDSVEKAEAALTAASAELNTAVSGNRDASKAVDKADSYLYKIWADMKSVCDTQDDLAKELNNFKENILTAFAALREKEPEPDPVEEPEAEVAEAEEAEAAAPEVTPAETVAA